MGYFYRSSLEEVLSIKGESSIWKMSCKVFGFLIEAIITEEGRHYNFYKNLETDEIYVDDMGKKHSGFDLYLFENNMDTAENLERALFEIIEKSSKEGKVFYPDSI